MTHSPRAPRKFIRDSFGYAFSQYVVRATLMLRGLIAARLLGPGGYGAWNAIQILMDWGASAPLGTQSGLDQLVPPAIVAGDQEALLRLKRAALFNIVLLTGLFAAVCVLWGTLGSRVLSAEWGLLGLGAAMLCALVVNVSYYQNSIMRSHGDITTASGWVALQGAIGGVLGLALVPWLHRWGLLLGWVVGCIAAFTFSTVRSRRLAPMTPVPGRDGVRLAWVGVPMYLFTVGWQLVSRSADRLIVLRYLGTEALGYYSLSVMALTFLLYLPDSVTFVIYPQLLSRFDASGRDPESIRARVERVLQASSIAVPALCAIAALCAGPVVAVLLPKFTPGVAAVRILCFGAPALAFASLASIVLMTVRRYAQLVLATLVGMVLFVGLDLSVVHLGYGLQGVAWATLTAYAVNSIVMLVLALDGLGVRAGRVLGLVARFFAPLVLAVVMVALLERFMPPSRHPGLSWRALHLAANLALFSVAYLVAVHPLGRNMGMMQLLSEVNLPVVGPLLRRLRKAGAPQDKA